MALNVNWNWRMPTVGDANAVAKTNQDYFMQGMDAIGQGIIKGGENKRADEKQAWLEDKDYRDFQHKLAQDRLAQMNETRDYFIRKDLKDLQQRKTDFDIQKGQYELDRYKQMMDELDKVAAQRMDLFANYGMGLLPEEEETYQRLLAQFGQQEPSDASMVLNGLNPQFRFRR